MTPLRALVLGLIGLLVLAPFLGFAGGDVALHIWNKHRPHAAGHHDTSRVAWKNTPGATEASRPALMLALVGWLAATEPVATMPAVSSPPFVPPRA